MIFWNQFQYIVLPFIPALWLLLTLQFTNTSYFIKKPYIFLMFLIPIITFFIRLTNSIHYFFYQGYQVKPFLGYNTLDMERGPWFYINIFFTILYILSSIIIYYLAYKRGQKNYSRPAFLNFFTVSLLPMVAIFLIILLYQRTYIDYVALVLPISQILIYYGILKYDFFETKSMVRNAFFEDSKLGMILLEPGLRIIDYNKAAEEFFNALNILLSDISIEELLKDRPELLSILKSDTSQELSLMIDGKEHFYEIEAWQIRENNNKESLKIIRDITDKKLLEKRLIYLATIDTLSGLYNRRKFMELAKMEFERAKRYKEGLCILMMDIDNFKNINDCWGHRAGDKVISEFGYLLKDSLRKTDIIGRLGGEEFAVILHKANKIQGFTLGENFRKKVVTTEVVDGSNKINFTISIGVVAIQGDEYETKDMEDILKQADEALYSAKTQGKNCVVVFGERLKVN